MTDDTKPCPVCAEIIKAAAVKCRFCNTDLEAYRLEQETAVERVLFAGHPAVLYSASHWVLAVVTLGIAYLVYWVRSRSTSYTLTNHRIRIERGLLSKLEKSVDLYRLDDFDVHKPLGMRLASHAILHVRSSDPDFRDVQIEGVPGIEAIADELRKSAIRDRARRGVTTFVNA